MTSAVPDSKNAMVLRALILQTIALLPPPALRLNGAVLSRVILPTISPSSLSLLDGWLLFSFSFSGAPSSMYLALSYLMYATIAAQL